ncbi:FUSC family protein [Amorphus coralli]|uniref:FUSC family protein n=1 Tax=Amorphus coralli TaxID=340680 RepID=UPI000360BE99|nr:FUSC family protein [Amorphus coralli]
MSQSLEAAQAATPFRYRHYRAFHGVRTGVGVLLCIGVGVVFGIPHGLWTAISFLVVMTGFHHHGNIRHRALERALGTMIGAAAGLLVLLQQEWLQLTPLTWGLIAGFCAICAYHAIGKGGYTALLSGLTLVIVAGHGSEPLDVGLWRALNVMIGIAIALALSFVQPIYATWFWRDVLSRALGHCREVLHAVETTPERPGLAGIGGTLQSLRGLMPSAAREGGLPLAHLEEIQRSVRVIVSSVELIAAAPIDPPDLSVPCRMLDEIAAALRAGRLAAMPTAEIPAAPVTDDADLSLVRVLDRELHTLARLLREAPGLWHGESVSR